VAPECWPDRGRSVQMVAIMPKIDARRSNEASATPLGDRQDPLAEAALAKKCAQVSVQEVAGGSFIPDQSFSTSTQSPAQRRSAEAARSKGWGRSAGRNRHAGSDLDVGDDPLTPE